MLNPSVPHHEASDPAAAPIVVFCRDLLFVSKITSAAQALHVPVKVIRDPSKLGDVPDATQMIVDLSQEGFLDSAAQWRIRNKGHVTGFAGHADTATIERAKAAGLDRVLSKGEFTARLAEILGESQQR